MSSNELTWKKTGADIRLDQCPQHVSIGLWYARIYTSGAGYEYSETNRWILNFKKPIDRPAQEIRWKQRAIELFVEELTNFLSKRTNTSIPILLTPAPGSFSKTGGHFDNRLEQVAAAVCKRVHGLQYFPVLIRTNDTAPQHKCQGSRDATKVFNSLAIDEQIAREYSSEKVIVVVDDVLLSGATFEGCRRKLLERFPGARIHGVFWAKSEPSPPFDDFQASELLA
jgi:hypothetical protein